MLGDNLHKMSKSIFLEKMRKQYFKMSSAEFCTQHANLGLCNCQNNNYIYCTDNNESNVLSLETLLTVSWENFLAASKDIPEDQPLQF